MANPAPTINQINAFNATQGTIIDFNIIGGTELVRSNKIYIYDLSDNSLICTHLYTSTESIHELPPNTDGSIVYESGKSSADFVNGKQYYAQIQTFTNIAGTQGGSGLSVSKLFWCLVDPSLTISTIPSTISTTSYNVSATYNANTSVVSNIIQQYQFNLYSATGSLLQSSGVVVGNGEQQGTSTAYDISYNFSGLEVGSSYYVVVEVTTTQGMSLSAQSGTFTVSIDTPTLGEATVVNNACDGYISVTSNLSSEHSHSYSVDAGEIMSFTTDSPNDVTKLQVNFNPTQEGTPWMASTYDTDPYTFRAIPNVNHSINSEFDTLVGGTVNWNAMIPIGNTSKTTTQNNVVLTDNRDGSYKIQTNGAVSTNTAIQLYRDDNTNAIIKDHKYLCTGFGSPSAESYRFVDYYNGVLPFVNVTTDSTVLNASGNGRFDIRFLVVAGVTIQSPKTVTPQITDLTAFFGNSATADYVYSLETANAGAGIAWLRKYFPDLFAYSPYNTGTLESVKPTAHVTRGVNQWDEEWTNGTWTQYGTINTNTQNVSCKNPIEVLPNTKYYFYCGSYPTIGGYGIADVYLFDENMTFIAYSPSGGYTGKYTFEIQTTTNTKYITFTTYASQYGNVYKNDICINLFDPSINGHYFPYEEHTYDIEPVDLNGMFVLDNGALKADGDIRRADGSVTRKWTVKNLATLSISDMSNLSVGDNTVRVYIGLTSMKPITSTTEINILADKLNCYVPDYIVSNDVEGISENRNANVNGFWIRIAKSKLASNDYAGMKSYFTSNLINVLYELKTPTTETVEPFTSPQTIYSGGTEEYITTGLVPVGHQSRYADIYPINGTSDVSVDIVGANQWDEEAEKGGYSSLTGVKETGTSRIRNANKIRCLPNTTYYIACVGTYTGWVALYFYDADENFISSDAINHINNPFTTPSNAYYMCFNTSDNYGATYNHDISINYPSTDTSYHAYNLNSQTITQQFDGSYVTYTPTTTNDDPYLFRKTGDVRGDRESLELVGGTVNWNQIVQNGNFADGTTNWFKYSSQNPTTTWSVSNGVLTHSITGGTTTHAYYYSIYQNGVVAVGGANHRYLISLDVEPSVATTFRLEMGGGAKYTTPYTLEANKKTTVTCIVDAYTVNRQFLFEPFSAVNQVSAPTMTMKYSNIHITDLTAFFGNSATADYVYSLEQANAGAGIAWLRKYFPDLFVYSPYNTGTLESVKPTAHVTRGVNQWDEEWELGQYYDGDGKWNASGTRVCSKRDKPIPVIPNASYYVGTGTTVIWFDENGKTYNNGAGYIGYAYASIVTAPSNAKYMRFYKGSSYGTTYKNDICINLSNPALNGKYFPADHHTYPITELELRGISKLVDGELRFDGDTRKADGSNNVNRKYGYVDFGVLYWEKADDWGGAVAFITQMIFSDAKIPSTNDTLPNCMSNYITNTRNSLFNNPTGSGFAIAQTGTLVIRDPKYSEYTADEFKTAMSGKYLVYEKATPTTETADAYEVPQMVNPLGTEEFVDTRSTPIPVGNNTQYFKREVFGGYIDLVSGVLTVDRVGILLDDAVFTYYSENFYICREYAGIIKGSSTSGVPPNAIAEKYIVGGQYDQAGIDKINIPANGWIYSFTENPSGLLVCELATPLTYQLTPHEIETLVGTNNVWSNAGDVLIEFNIPITNLLVKRQDVADVSGNWLTLYSQPVEQASDMDFTFIDFLNQYGKTYKYALVPLLTQTQSGVEVEVEGGYTVSDEVQSIFDGVYIGDSTGVQRLKAGVAYNNLNTNQQVGVIPTLGNKYPIIVSNSNIQYDIGSVSGLIVPDDFYSDGNLSRLDMSSKREAINDFLTNKKPKILKDWNGNIWLVVFTDNVDVSFDNNYGMGVATFTSGWTEVGDPTNQEDLQRTGLINVGGD